jgi:hypothetical protein
MMPGASRGKNVPHGTKNLKGAVLQVRIIVPAKRSIGFSMERLLLDAADEIRIRSAHEVHYCPMGRFV